MMQSDVFVSYDHEGKKTAHFVLLWSKSASQSRWVNAEWITAWRDSIAEDAFS